MPRRKYKATHAPAPGTFAAFVVSLPIEMKPVEAAKRARAAGWPKTKPSSVSSVRYYYGLRRERAPLAAVHARTAASTGNTVTASVSAARRAPRSGAGAVDDVDAELDALLMRAGTDRVRRALARAESRALAIVGVRVLTNGEASAGGL